MADLQTTWGWLVATYLFLGGLGAGCFCAVASVALFSRERFKSTVCFGAWASVSALALGTLLLLADVGKPFRAIVLFKSFVNLNSWMAVGAWLLFGAILLNGLFALFWTERALVLVKRVCKPLFQRRGLLKSFLAVLGIPVNLGVAAYTGMLLSVLPFRPFWHTALLPVLFTISAADTGLGVVAAHVSLRQVGDAAKKLRTALEVSIVVLIMAEARVLLAYLDNMMLAGPDALRSVQLLMSGPLMWPFWVLVVGMGLGVPLLVCAGQLTGLFRKRAAVLFPMVGLVSCVAGGFTLRWIVLAAGLSQSLVSPSLEQMLDQTRFLLR